MGRKEVEWIWEYVLKHCSNRRLTRYLMEAFPLQDDNLRLKKMVLLRSMSNEVDRGLHSDIILKLLHSLGQLTKSETIANEVCEGIEVERTGGLTSGSRLPDDEEETLRGLGQGVVKENGEQMLELQNGIKLDDRDENGSRKSTVEMDKGINKRRMLQISLKDRIKAVGRELDLALKVELTVQHLRDGVEGWPAFLEALDKYWNISEHDKEEVDNGNKEINIARQEMKLELWATKANPRLQSEVISKYKQDTVEKTLKRFLDLAWEEIGPTFLEKLEEDVVKGAYKPAGGANLGQVTGKALYREDHTSRNKVTQERSCMEMGDVAKVRTVSQEIQKNANHVERKDITGPEITSESQEKPLQSTNLIAQKGSSATTEQRCNSRVDTQILSRCLQGPPLEMLKISATTRTSNSIAEGHTLEEGATQLSGEGGLCFVRNKQHDAISSLELVGQIESEAKDGEASIGLGRTRLLQQSEVMQREELEQGLPSTGASDVHYHMNHSFVEADDGLEEPCTAIPMETNNNQLKNAGEILNLASPPTADFDSLQRVDVEEAPDNEELPKNHYAEKSISIRISEVPSVEQIVSSPNRETCCLSPPPWTSLQSKPVPSLMRGSIAKRRLYRKGIIDERLIGLATEKSHNERSMGLADPEISKAQEALKDSQVNLQSRVKDPLPTAMQIANEAREYIKQSVQSSPAPEKDELGEALLESQPQEGDKSAILKPEAINLRKLNLINRNASARTIEKLMWEDKDMVQCGLSVTYIVGG